MLPPVRSNMLPPGSVIGILGGGQLGRMLAVAAAELGMECQIYAEEENPPAAQTANRSTCARFDDYQALKEFARSVDVLTYEFENIPLETVRQVACIRPLRPSEYSLKISQDRLNEKIFLREQNLSTASFFDFKDEADLQRALDDTGYPAIIKTRNLGYDGKGQYFLHRSGDIHEALSALNSAPAIVEKVVDFNTELAVIAVRAEDGTICCFDVTATYHEKGILRRAECPADIHPVLEERVQYITTTIAQALEHVGVLTVEFFLLGNPQDEKCAEKRLLVNEIAPRVHNAGHWTREGCTTSQFEQHIRAICGWPLRKIRRHSTVVLTNILGDEIKQWAGFGDEPNTSLHLYGKNEIRSKRKMGHIIRVRDRSEKN